MLLASQMHADFGWMILLGLCAAIPGMLIAGPLFGNFIGNHVSFSAPPEDHQPDVDESKLPSFGFSLSLILFPLVLVGLKTIGARFTTEGTTLYEWLEFIGHPFTAILLALLVAIYGLAYRQGMDKERVMQVCGSALQPAGIILLVIGAGGVFKQVLGRLRRGSGAGQCADRRRTADCAGLLYPVRCGAGDSGIGNGRLSDHGRLNHAGGLNRCTTAALSWRRCRSASAVAQ
ncbi:Gnt-I system [Pantoea agglomerans]|uniref:Gnt-I system n=1 Tax=Enterobacter agglomerans TaxID=549 RepID=A0A379A9M6_ENTAG|nr:Gnt-I system [Pantoea agglomerans]